jgi:transaldolase
VYADQKTSSEAMAKQGQEMFGWIPNAHVKYPVTTAGLAAAEQTVKAGMRVNMTLCFSQEQAAAVYAATKGAKPGNALVSPFAGRLDDIGENGMGLVANIFNMYKAGDGHTQVLAASIRSMDHFMQSLALDADIITAPFGILEAWAKAGKPLPDANFTYTPADLKNIPYQDISLDQPWSAYDIHHELTDKGITRFSADWNELIGS